MMALHKCAQQFAPLPLRERVARTQCVTGEGSLQIGNCELHSTPHPALRATFSRKGRRVRLGRMHK